MHEKVKRTSAQWVELLSKKELPAITSVAGMLDKFCNDDISSIPKLSKAILHDQALSSCVLKVVNNVNRISQKKVTTVSRASIVLGIHAIKNICLTSKVLDGLLQNNVLSNDVYNRLTRLMANAFHAGLLAKMMLPNYCDETQEEVYLAAMLYHIGETSFWSCNSDMAEQLIKKVALPDKEFQEHCEAEAGVQFKDLSIGLAKTWHLGDLLIKSLDQPENRTIEMQAISLANQLSAVICSPADKKSEFDKILKNVCTIMDVDLSTLKERIEQTRVLAVDLLSSYGVSLLKKHIKTLPKGIDFTAPELKLSLPLLLPINQEQAVLSVLKELTKLAKNSKSINGLLNFTLQQIANALHFDYCSFWILNKNKNNIESRISYDNDGGVQSRRHCIALNKHQNIVNYVLNNENAILVNDYREKQWHAYITPDIEKLLTGGAICFAPISINNKKIGMISAQVFDKSAKINEKDFSQFGFIVDHLNMCLSIASNR